MATCSNSVQQCKVCGEYQTLDHFRPTRWGGVTTVCNSCMTSRRFATLQQRKDVSLGGKSLVRYASGKDSHGVSDPKFEGFTSRELLLELQSRGYRWDSMWLEKVEVVKAKVKL